jgi:hypothetical protein
MLYGPHRDDSPEQDSIYFTVGKVVFSVPLSPKSTAMACGVGLLALGVLFGGVLVKKHIRLEGKISD